MYHQLYTEAVFTDGKKTLNRVLECVKAVKLELEKQINLQHEKKDKDGKVIQKSKKFNPQEFWRNKVWKDLEDSISKCFGVRICSIEPFIEKYNAKEDYFETRIMNAFVYQINRYPIEALITDKGLYDKSHSLIIEMHISLGIIKSLEPEEILAVILHEIGHGIDPGLVDIKFLETNVLSKYITDRKKEINKNEEKVESIGFLELLIMIFKRWIHDFTGFFKRLFLGKKKYEESEINRLLKKVKKALDKEDNDFNRKEYSEAFADNFARMYGYGSYLMKALQKMDHEANDIIKSYIKRESERQEFITQMTIDMISDEHKTNIHRIRSLLREYNADLNDPNIPAKVKKNIQEDKKELEIVLDQYLNHHDELQARINRLIDEEIQKTENENKPKEEKKEEVEEIKTESSSDYIQLFPIKGNTHI